MRWAAASAAIGLALLGACRAGASGSGSAHPAPAGPDPSFHAHLSRGMCLGPCPVYSVDIDSAGNVVFVGGPSNMKPNAPCQGERRWRISPAALARLEATIDRAQLFGMKDRYTGGITDAPGFAVSVTRRGKTKNIDDYVGLMAGMPHAVVDVEDAIDTAAGDRACVAAPGQG